MKSSIGTRVLLSAAALLLAAPLLGAPAQAQGSLSITLGQPGFYGRIDMGDAPPPRLVYRRPVVIERGRERSEPIYLRVPPGHARHWRNHCREYDACGENVYFVRNDWYSDVYVPHYRDTHGDRRGRHGRHDDRRDEHGGNDSRDHRRNPHRDGDSRGDSEQRYS